MEMSIIFNERREFISIWMPGALSLSVMYATVDSQAVYRGEVVFSKTVYVKGGCPSKLAGLPKPWVKEVFIFFSKHKGFSC